MQCSPHSNALLSVAYWKCKINLEFANPRVREGKKATFEPTKLARSKSQPSALNNTCMQLQSILLVLLQLVTKRDNFVPKGEVLGPQPLLRRGGGVRRERHRKNLTKESRISDEDGDRSEVC
jgi:hypothetical protein